MPVEFVAPVVEVIIGIYLIVFRKRVAEQTVRSYARLRISLSPSARSRLPWVWAVIGAFVLLLGLGDLLSWMER